MSKELKLTKEVKLHMAQIEKENLAIDKIKQENEERLETLRIARLYRKAVNGFARGRRNNTDVIVWKNVLRSKGYQGLSDSNLFGESTEIATKKFQEDNKLPITGYVDEETLKVAGIIKGEDGSYIIPEEYLTK